MVVCAMQLYLFQSDSDLEMFSLTSDATGGNLPVEWAPWRWAGNRAWTLDELRNRVSGHELGDAIIGAIEGDGFFLARRGPRHMKGNNKTG